MAGSKDDEVVGESKETTAETSNESAPAAVAAPADPSPATPAENAPQPAVDGAGHGSPAGENAEGPTESEESDDDETDDETDDDETDDDETDDGETDDGETDDDDSAPEAAPEPQDEPAPLFDQHPWAITARVLAISALLGLALSSWAQLSIKSAWVPDFLINNTRGVAERKLMLTLLLAGLGVGGAAGIGLLSWFRKRSREAELERWLWFLVPGIMLPCLPALFRAKPWQNRYEALLPIVILLSLLFEALMLLSLRSVPSQ
ncbi:MAG: hypothetical protein ABUL60_02190, partial [Myxococcales bacterium]